MSIESGTYSFLTSCTEIVNVVGTRISPHHLPASPIYPAMTFQVISTTHVESLHESEGIVKARIQFDVWSLQLLDCVNVIEELRQQLQRYTGPYGTETCLSSSLISDRNLSEPPQDGSQRWLYRKSSDYLIALRES